MSADQIVVTVPSAIYTVTNYKPGNSPQLLARKFPSNNDKQRANDTGGDSLASVEASERKGLGVGVVRMTEQPDFEGLKEWSKRELEF